MPDVYFYRAKIKMTMMMMMMNDVLKSCAKIIGEQKISE